MPILNIITLPDKRLRQVASPLQRVDDLIRQHMLDMVDTMKHENGIGLAANQVAILKRIIVVDIASSDDEDRAEGFYPLMMANPQIIWQSEETASFNEGCLSLPGEEVNVIRPRAIKLKYLDFNNQEQILESSQLLARVVQHEIDHLNGVTIIDYLSKLKKDISLKRLTKLKCV